MVLRALALSAILMFVTGCATLSSGPSQQTPAPALDKKEQLLPQADGTSDPTIDPTYMRSQADYHFTMAEALSLEGRSEKATEEFKLTLVYDPESVTVRMRLAAEYVRQGLLSEAIEYGEGAVEKDPQSQDARMLLAGLYSSIKMYDHAREQYDEVLRLNPEHSEAAIYVGAILAEQKKYGEAIALFGKLAAQPGNKDAERAYYYLGRIYLERDEKGDTQNAETAFSKALQEKTDYTEAVLALASLYKETEREPAALKMLESFQEKFGPSKEVAKVLSREYLDKEDYEKAYEHLEVIEGFERDNLNVRVQLALILIEQKKFLDAAMRLEDILMQAPDLDKIRYYLGAVYEELKRYDLSVQNYQLVPPSSLYFADATIHAAHIYKSQAKHVEAAQVIEAAIKRREDLPQFYAYYATLLDEQKDFKKALKMLENAVEKFPNHAQLQFFLGSMHDRLGESDKTIAAMKRVLEIDNQHVQAMNYLAYTYAEQNIELELAEDLARRALAAQPTDGYILDTMGWVLFKKGKTSQALRYLEAAYKTKGDEAIIAEHLGDAYFRSQLLGKARTMYQKAMQLETEPSKANKVKEKLASTERQLEELNRMPASTPTDPKPAPTSKEEK